MTLSEMRRLIDEYKVALECPGAVVSDNALVRHFAKLFGRKAFRASRFVDDARKFLAFREAVELLRRKGVPVFFYNRVGLNKSADWSYSPAAQRRMREKLQFPAICAEPKRYEADLRELFGEKYSPAYVREISRIPQVVKVGESYVHEDCATALVNVVGGRRVTVGAPERWKRSVHMYGRCGVFGYAVEDADTLPSLLQSELRARGADYVRVVNHGLWGSDNECIDSNFMHDALDFREGDVVVFYRKHLDLRLMRRLQETGLVYADITEAWHRFPEARWCFYDRPGHMVAQGYRNVAKLLADDLLACGFAEMPHRSDDACAASLPNLTAYLKSRNDAAFAGDMAAYLGSVRASVGEPLETSGNGAVVMNCNPFTKGHRYLIEYAASRVKRLFVFVVEEDKSAFRFADRLEMVRRGTADLGNVIAVPSGKFIISAMTFPEYFMKDYVKSKAFDVSSDVRVFCAHIAPTLGITVRFAGQEPFDAVTRNYNACMASLLPEYGMEFCEIPRLSLAGGKVVNATEVRRLLAARDEGGLAEYVPATTLAVLKRSYWSEGES